MKHPLSSKKRSAPLVLCFVTVLGLLGALLQASTMTMKSSSAGKKNDATFDARTISDKLTSEGPQHDSGAALATKPTSVILGGSHKEEHDVASGHQTAASPPGFKGDLKQQIQVCTASESETGKWIHNKTRNADAGADPDWFVKEKQEML
jgi:hypothetical protein